MSREQGERGRARRSRGRVSESVLEEMYPHNNITNHIAFITLLVVHLNVYILLAPR